MRKISKPCRGAWTEMRHRRAVAMRRGSVRQQAPLSGRAIRIACGRATPIKGNTSSIPRQSFRTVWDALRIQFFSVPLAGAGLSANRALANTTQIGAASGFGRACCEKTKRCGGGFHEGYEPDTTRLNRDQTLPSGAKAQSKRATVRPG